MNRPGTIEAQLDEHGVYYATTVGDSMAPLFHTHQKVVFLRKKTGRLRRLDVPLVRRDDGGYVLHRIVRVLPDGYVTRGDNRLHCDPPVREDQVLARMEGYYTGSVYTPVTAPRYRAYVCFWAGRNPWRLAFLACCALLGKVRRIFRKKNHKKNG